MPELFGSDQPTPADQVEAQEAVSPQATDEAKVEKTFTATDVEQIVKDRLLREQKKHQKTLDELQKPKPKSDNVEQDLRNKLSEFEINHKTLSERLASYRDKSLRGSVMSKLSEAGCNDPELLTDHLLSKKLVHLDEDDSVIVENANNSLDDLIRSELNKRPHLVKPSGMNGLGSKAPSSKTKTVISSDQLRNASPEEYQAWKEQNIAAKSKRLFD